MLEVWETNPFKSTSPDEIALNGPSVEASAACTLQTLLSCQHGAGGGAANVDGGRRRMTLDVFHLESETVLQPGQTSGLNHQTLS